MNIVRHWAELPDSLHWNEAMMSVNTVTGCPVRVLGQKRAEVHIDVKEAKAITNIVDIAIKVMKRMFRALNFRADPQPRDPTPGHERVIAEIPDYEVPGQVVSEMDQRFINTLYSVHHRVGKSGAIELQLIPGVTESWALARIKNLGIQLTPMPLTGQKIRERMKALPKADQPITIDENGNVLEDDRDIRF